MSRHLVNILMYKEDAMGLLQFTSKLNSCFKNKIKTHVLGKSSTIFSSEGNVLLLSGSSTSSSSPIDKPTKAHSSVGQVNWSEDDCAGSPHSCSASLPFSSPMIAVLLTWVAFPSSSVQMFLQLRRTVLHGSHQSPSTLQSYYLR